MAATERLEAKGPRGEACIIVRTWTAPRSPNGSDQAADRGLPSYRLGTGERLRPTDNPAVFETLDRTRQFTLR
jgi:hypothetical protein